jgi:RND family efflux transporter MFP subunit
MGRLVFIDNAVDTASGTIGLKAEFPNADKNLWPGMFVTVTLSPRMLEGALTVPVQAVQNGPEGKFIYVVGGDSTVNSIPVNIVLIQDGLAVIEGEGIAPGVRIVVEGAQNVRPGGRVAEAAAKGSAIDKGSAIESAVPRKPDEQISASGRLRSVAKAAA